ncbi:prenyltransferase/squalene oxidase repeat-containing protein [Streptomyces wuyuanensis]|uniref:prenyltransferase/squalene oxidase repeat-containing protein n=1 Tax=Streptomyces wuyuanensis TaxID=1196353 RepID=UPI0034146162
MPSVTPITVFERAWVLAALHRARLHIRVPVSLLDSLEHAVANGPTGGAPGLPADADTTSVVISVLNDHGRPRSPAPLFDFENGTHFFCWADERTPSPTANAHILTALARHTPDAASARGLHAISTITDWLCTRQAPDGSWTDKWHASPYYATAGCALALAHHARPRAQPAIERALAWLLDTQRPDGSWGRWQGTAEESAYAVQTLLLAGDRSPGSPHTVAAIRARTLLADAATTRCAQPPLWHDKDLYCPDAIVEAEILAAWHLTENRLRQARTAPGPRTGGPAHE